MSRSSRPTSSTCRTPPVPARAAPPRPGPPTACSACVSSHTRLSSIRMASPEGLLITVPLMSEVTHRTIQANGIDMHIAEQGDGPPVVLCHGFPELWYSWRHQLPALAAAGFHAIAPDQRGYGGTSR